MLSLHVLAIWIGAFITVCIFSSLLRDNPLYRLAEHLFVGVSAGYYFSAIAFHQVLKPNFLARLFPSLFGSGMSAQPEYLLIIPGILGLLIFSRLSGRYTGLSNISVAFVMGVVSAITLVTSVKEYLLPQIQKAFVPLYIPGNVFLSGSNVILLVGTVSCLFYFFFSIDQSRPWVKGLSGLGLGFLMISFGASFGATVMGRVSLLIGRFQFLIQDFGGTLAGNGGTLALVLAVGMVSSFFILQRRAKHGNVDDSRKEAE